MTDQIDTQRQDHESETEKAAANAAAEADQARRAALRALGRFALVSAPAVTLLLAAGTKPSRSACLISAC